MKYLLWTFFGFLFLSSTELLAQRTSTTTFDGTWKKTFREKFKATYFSEYLGDAFEKGDGTYPEVDENGDPVQGSEPTQLWNQISLGWQTTDKWRIIFNPRFTSQLGDRSRLSEDNGSFRTEDFLAGFQGTLWKKDDWSIWIRPGYRLPTSQATQNANWHGQAEWFQILEKTSNSSTRWGYGLFTIYRNYIRSEESTSERWRIYNSPYVYFRFNDKVRWEAYYEEEIQHNATAGEKEFSYSKRTFNGAFTGVTYFVNEKFSVFPFVKSYTAKKFDTETLGLGAWIVATLY